jgi:hypothetical protein
MSAPKHTPGPWTDMSDRTVNDASGTPLLRCYAGRNEWANAQLVAAAPDLLAALTSVREFVRGQLDIVLHSYCLIGDDGKPRLETLDDSDCGAVGEAMQALGVIDAALVKAGAS